MPSRRTSHASLCLVALLACVGCASLASAQLADHGLDVPPSTASIERDADIDAARMVEEMGPLAPIPRVEIGGGATLTLAQVLASVERHHPAMEVARQRVRGADGDRLAAEGGFDLGVEASGWAAPVGYYDWGRANVTLSQPTPLFGASVFAGYRIGRGGDVPAYYGEYETLDLGEVRAGIRVPLWQDGPIDQRRSRLWRAEHAADAERATLDARRLAMRLEAASAYWSWAAAARKYEVASRLLSLAETRDGQIRGRVAAGALPALEALENRRVVVQRRGSLVSARRALEQAAIRLSLYHRDGSGRPRVPRGAAAPRAFELPGPVEVELRREVERAWAQRPETSRFESLVEREEVNVEYAENRLAPRIDLGVAASIDLGAGSDPIEREVLGAPVLEGSVLVSFPLQFREARGGIDRARADLASLREEARLMRDRIATEVQDAHSAVIAAEQRLDAARESVRVADAVTRAERRRFELGATQLLFVNLREQALAAAEAELVDAEASLALAHAAWDAARGGAAR
ncbi:MAG: TolC family protein [Sandaracinaceae bacterium]